MQKSMKYGMLWNAGGNVIYLACQWVITVLVTRITGFEDAGVLSLAMSLGTTLQTISMFGIRNFQVSDMDNEYRNSTYVAFRHITSFAALAVCIVFSIISDYTEKQFWAIAFYMLFRLAESYSDVLHGIAQKNDRLDIAGKALAIKAIFTTVAFFIGYISLDSLNLGLALMAIASVLTTVLYDYTVVRSIERFSLFDTLNRCFSLAKKTLPLCIYMFLFSAISTIPKMVLEIICDEATLGAYSSIYAPATLIQAATAYIYNPFATLFALFHRNRDYAQFFKTLIKITAFIIALSGIVLLLASLIGEWALVILFGESIREHAHLLIPILLVTVLMAILGFFCMLEIILRDFTGLITACALGAVSSLVLSIILINTSGVTGTSIALIISAAVAVSVTLLSILLKIRKFKNA